MVAVCEELLKILPWDQMKCEWSGIKDSGEIKEFSTGNNFPRIY